MERSNKVNQINPYPYFYVIFPRVARSDIYYKVFVTKTAFCGAKIAGQIFDEESADYQLLHPLGWVGLLFVPLVAKIIDKRGRIEERYAAVDVTSPRFLALDKNNFCFTANEIDRVILNKKRSFHTGMVPNKGTLEFRFNDKSEKKFLFPADQNVESVTELIAKIIPNMIVIE